MCANVVTLMAIFVGIFSLVNVNLMGTIGEQSAETMIALNLAIIASLAFLFGLITTLVKGEKGYRSWAPWVASAVAFVAALLVLVIV